MFAGWQLSGCICPGPHSRWQDLAWRADVAQAAPIKNSLGVPFIETAGTPVLIAAWETRVSDFAAFVRESGYVRDFKPHFPQSGDHPVVNVTMRDAMAYCNWLTKREQNAGKINELQSYRLPTGKEWDAAVGLASGRKPTPLAIELEEDKQKYPVGHGLASIAPGGQFKLFRDLGER